MFSLISVSRYRVSYSELKYLINAVDKNHAAILAKSWNIFPSCFQDTSYIRIEKYSTDNQKKKVVVSEDSPSDVSTTFQSVKENTKTLWYGSVMLIGLGITGAIFTALFTELFSGNSPNNIYSKALNRCIEDEKVIFSLGEPIKGYGEKNSRGRARHVSHLIYEKDGVNYIRMKFYIKGCRRSATVHLEMVENENKKYDYRYLFVQLDEYPYSTIILEDNRGQKALAPVPSLENYPDVLKNM